MLIRSGLLRLTLLRVVLDPSSEAADRRLATSLRLKAGRYLAGTASPDGKRAVPITVKQLADHPLIKANGITRNRLDDYEQMATDPRPMELRVVAEALGVAPGFLLGESGSSDEKLDRILAILETIQTTTEQRYAELEERLAGLHPEEALEVVRLLHEARVRQGRDIGRRSLPAARTKDRQEGP